ncbi:unnamed protein product [Moneuplotes crassus]|uniref:PH domain-containing protein n=2 Tax=Euplotes crassus TaxID=5936 RepID=A0AAD2D681_EUPCR|nr:unnamed protein product [Moneuplotes crassus]
MMAPPLVEDEDDVLPPVIRDNDIPIENPLMAPPPEIKPPILPTEEEAPGMIPGPFSSEEQKIDAFNIYKEGWVYKQSRYLKSWRQRWTVLTRTHLYTYKMEQEYLLKGPGCFTECIECSDISKVRSAQDEVGIDNSFVLTTRNTKEQFYFYCDKEEDKKAWTKQIQRAAISDRVKLEYEQERQLNRV